MPCITAENPWPAPKIEQPSSRFRIRPRPGPGQYERDRLRVPVTSALGRDAFFVEHGGDLPRRQALGLEPPHAGHSGLLALSADQFLAFAFVPKCGLPWAQQSDHLVANLLGPGLDLFPLDRWCWSTHSYRNSGRGLRLMVMAREKGQAASSGWR
jgi:hypothetical protein